MMCWASKITFMKDGVNMSEYLSQGRSFNEKNSQWALLILEEKI